MASLLQQLANSVTVICNCDFKPEYFTNGRWICNPTTPTVVRLRADVAGTGVVPSTTLASDVNRWAQTTTTSLSVVGDNLAVTGSETCTNRDCTTEVPTTQGNAYWVIGLIGGVVVLAIVISVAVVILLMWRRSKQDKPIA